MSMDVNQKYCQSCHLISRMAYYYENNYLTDMLIMYARFPEGHHPGPRQLLI
jgi:hypothetical protein